MIELLRQGFGAASTAWVSLGVFLSEARKKGRGQRRAGMSEVGSVDDKSDLFEKVSGNGGTRCSFLLTGSDMHNSQVRMTRHQLVDSKLRLSLHLDVACGDPRPENIFC